MIGLALLCTSVALSVTSDDLLALRAARPGDAVLPGWATRAVRGQRLPTSAVVDSAGDRFLRLSGQAAAGLFVHRLASPHLAPHDRLALSWRVLTAPAGADLRLAATDDSALRFFVVFASRSRFERTPRTLFYSTGSVEPPTYSRASFQSTALHVIRIGSGTARGRWHDCTIDPFVDYRRIWGEPARAVVAVGLMQDSDDTRGVAVADVRTFSWSTPSAKP